MDDKTFENLHIAICIPTLEKLSNDKLFWRERIETLTGRAISIPCDQFPLEDWKDAYRILKRDLHTLWNIEDNTLAVLILLNREYSREVLHSSIKNAAANNYHKTLDEEALCDSLLLASARGHLQSMTILLEDGRADPSKDDKKVFWCAIRREQYESAALLLNDKRMPALTQNERISIMQAMSLSSVGMGRISAYIQRDIARRNREDDDNLLQR